jgi:hypothetical protein
VKLEYTEALEPKPANDETGSEDTVIGVIAERRGRMTGVRFFGMAVADLLERGGTRTSVMSKPAFSRVQIVKLKSLFSANETVTVRSATGTLTHSRSKEVVISTTFLVFWFGLSRPERLMASWIVVS